MACCGKRNLRNRNLHKICEFLMYGTSCSNLFLYNFEARQNLPYKIGLPGYKLYPFSCTSSYLRILFWAFSDPQRPGLPEIYPKIWRFRHCLNPKNVRFWTKKTHCATHDFSTLKAKRKRCKRLLQCFILDFSKRQSAFYGPSEW